MDNDIGIIKNIKRIIKQTQFTYIYIDVDVMNDEQGNGYIGEMIKSGQPFSAIRGGATELRCVDEYLKHGNYFSDKIKREIKDLSGFFPPTDDNLRRFSEYYIDSMGKGDLIALWNVGAENEIVHNCTLAKFSRLRCLEPYYFHDPWSKNLEGINVLVVHPFSETIEKQYKKRKFLFDRDDVLPEFKSLKTITAIQSSAGEMVKYNDWFDALESMKDKIAECDFDLAIIGAGAYSLPLAVFCKELGKQSIQMSGATQILFGIKGKRWDDHPYISKLYNNYWVRPSKKETPKLNNVVEGGSYW